MFPLRSREGSVTTYFRALYLLSSLLPLCVLLGVAAYSTNPMLTAFSAGAATISFVCFIYTAFSMKTGAKDFRKIVFAKNANESIFSYTISILPPLLIDDFSNYSKIIPVATFYTIMFAILMRSQIITLNPLFIIFGYKISFVVFEGSSNEAVVISKQLTDLYPGRMSSIWEIQRSSVFYLE